MSETPTLDTLTCTLVAALRRDAEALEADGAPDLARLADRLDELLAYARQRPEIDARRALVDVLDAVETFHARVRASHARTADAIQDAAQRRLARRAYGEAERHTVGRPS